MKKYQTEFKLKVVKSFLAGDGGAKLLARQWSVPEEKIRTWVSHYRPPARHRWVAPQAQHVQCAVQATGAVPSGPRTAINPPGCGDL